MIQSELLYTTVPTEEASLIAAIDTIRDWVKTYKVELDYLKQFVPPEGIAIGVTLMGLANFAHPIQVGFNVGLYKVLEENPIEYTRAVALLFFLSTSLLGLTLDTYLLKTKKYTAYIPASLIHLFFEQKYAFRAALAAFLVGNLSSVLNPIDWVAFGGANLSSEMQRLAYVNLISRNIVGSLYSILPNILILLGVADQVVRGIQKIQQKKLAITSVS